MTDTTTTRTAADYTLWWPPANATCIGCGGAESGGWSPPVLGLREGPLCATCRDGEPMWVGEFAQAAWHLDAAAAFCPPELRAGLRSSILAVAAALVDRIPDDLDLDAR